jgi:O-ureido-D-serine cyclo-ligase
MPASGDDAGSLVTVPGVLSTYPPGVILVVTSDLSALPFDDPDEEPLRAALARAGLEARLERWDDPDVDWDGASLVVLRSTWDYVPPGEEFLAWMRRVSAVTTVLNSLPVVTWNSDKRYLAQLAERGVPVVPTRYLDAIDDFAPAVAGLPGSEVVVKPSVSNGSGMTGRFARHDSGAAGLVREILAAGRQVMVQPYLESVTEDGESALIMIGGEFSHAVRKGPLLAPGGGLLGGSYTETVTPVSPSARQREVAQQVLAHAEELAGARPHYARVDLVAGAAGEPLCLELELIEPSLFFDQAEGSADRFVRSLAAVQRQ